MCEKLNGSDLDRVSGCMFQVHTWEPSIQNPYRGYVVWPVPENIDITVTLFRDPRQADFEDKEWTFHIEDVSTSIMIIHKYVYLNFPHDNFPTNINVS
jgi:hypothetical protein